jgi:flagellar hook-length control protein FliK
MTIGDLTDRVQLDVNLKNTDYTAKNCSKSAGNAFLNILATANKANEFAFGKEKNYSYADSKYSYKKEFQSEYENFYNKFGNDKKYDDSIKHDHSEKKASHHDKKAEYKTENKNDVSEKVHEEKQEVKAKQPEDHENKKVSDENKHNNQEAKNSSESNEQGTETKKETKDEESCETNQNPESSNQDKTAEKDETSENNEEILEEIQGSLQTTEIALGISNSPKAEQPQNMQAIISQKASTEDNTTDKKAESSTQNNSQNIASGQQKNNVKVQQEEVVADEKVKKPEILATTEAADKLNLVDKKLIGQSDEKVKAASVKLADAMENQDAKPVITNVEVKTQMDAGGQSNQQQQNFKPANQIQSVALENSLQKTEGPQTSQFSKVLNVKQEQNTQNVENSVLNQVKDKVSAEISSNKSQVSIVLNPQHLGKVNINIVSQNGVLTAQITAENKDVKDILNKGLDGLKQSLTEQGINVGKFAISVQEPSSLNNNNDSDKNNNEFEQANTGSDLNYESNKDNHSQETSSGKMNNKFYNLAEEAENLENNGEILNGVDDTAANSNNTVGKVDYRV